MYRTISPLDFYDDNTLYVVHLHGGIGGPGHKWRIDAQSGVQFIGLCYLICKTEAMCQKMILGIMKIVFSIQILVFGSYHHIVLNLLVPT